MGKYFWVWLVGVLLVTTTWMAPVQAEATQDQALATPAPSYYVLVPQRSGVTRRVKRMVPSAWLRRLEGKRYLQAGLFRDAGHAQTLVTRLQKQGLAAVIKIQTQSALVPIPLRPISRTLPPPPALPLTATRDLPALPVVAPAPYVSLTRVLIPTEDFARSTELQQQVVGAFQREVKGRRYIQIGAFSQTENLTQMVSVLRQQGILPMIQEPEE